MLCENAWWVSFFLPSVLVATFGSSFCPSYFWFLDTTIIAFNILLVFNSVFSSNMSSKYSSRLHISFNAACWLD